MDNYVTGSVIRKLRESKKMTQEELAERIFVSAKAVSKWETGQGFPDISLLEPLAKALDISVIELLSGEDVRNSNPAANMLKVKFYVCPLCGNVIQSVGEAVISCCGITLPPAEAEPAGLADIQAHSGAESVGLVDTKMHSEAGTTHPDGITACPEAQPGGSDATFTSSGGVATPFAHSIHVEIIEDEYYVTVDHPMEKDHFISFLAAVSDQGVQFVKLYPEGCAEARFKRSRVKWIYAYCNRHGLFRMRPPIASKSRQQA